MLKWPTILVKFRWNSIMKLRISHVTPIQSTYLTFSGEYFSSPFPMLRFEFNWPLPSSKNPQFQNEAKCTTVLVKTPLISMRIKNHFHIKGWALKLVLIQRPGGTRKCPMKQVPHVAASVFVNKRTLRDETCVTTLGCIHTIPVPTGKVWKALETARDCSKSFTHIEHRAGAVGREGLVN